MTIKHTLSILSHLGSNTLGCLLKDIGVHVSAVGQILAVFLLKLSSLRAQGLFFFATDCFLSCSFTVNMNLLESQPLENFKQVTALTAFTNVNLESTEKNKLTFWKDNNTFMHFQKAHNIPTSGVTSEYHCAEGHPGPPSQ